MVRWAAAECRELERTHALSCSTRPHSRRLKGGREVICSRHRHGNRLFWQFGNHRMRWHAAMSRARPAESAPVADLLTLVIA
jgi:hypothetical protein